MDYQWFKTKNRDKKEKKIINANIMQKCDKKWYWKKMWKDAKVNANGKSSEGKILGRSTEKD